MGQSLVMNYVHIVFSTKNRHHLIDLKHEEELYRYLGSICSSLVCMPIRVGGHSNHVHILCNLSRKIALMKLLEKVKSHSSKWMKTKDRSLANFYWQDGYGSFSVSPSDVERVAAYIANQHEHHGGSTYEEEFMAFLKKYNVEYDERYVWD